MQTEKQYFDNHETVERLFFTSDQLAFFDEQNAINHSKSLDDPTITTKTREQVDAELESIINGDWMDPDFELGEELDAE
jgi:hypothetical protein